MTIEHHNLADEFPEHKEKLHDMKMNNHHFQHLSEKYYAVNDKIRQSELDLSPITDAALEDLKKERLHLKDEIAKMLDA